MSTELKGALFFLWETCGPIVSDFIQQWPKSIILSTAPGPGLIATAKAHNCKTEIISKWTKGGETGWLKRL